MKSTYILLLAATFAAACNNSIDGSNEVKTTLPVTPPTILSPTDTSKKSTVVPPTVTAGTASTKPLTLNPAHGQPGHRCDLAVGAPLSDATATSPLNVPGSVTATSQPSSGQPIQNISAAKTPLLQLEGSNTPQSGVRLNPAHGQPGHDCSIEVGKPLKQ